MADKKASELWQDYRFLTQEMVKFLTKQDMNLFYDLMDQRERLQTLIDQTVDDGFKASPIGRSLLLEIKQESQLIIRRLQLVFNNSKRQQQVSDAYSSHSAEPVNRSWNR